MEMYGFKQNELPRVNSAYTSVIMPFVAVRSDLF